jgi:hypothetical protein
VSTEQQQSLDAILRQSAFPADIGISEQRRLLRELISAQPLPADVTVTPAAVDDALAAYQALLDNGTAPSDIAFAGESAGSGLAVATMVNARDHGLPLPPPTSCPLRRPHLAGTTLDTKGDADPLLSPQALQARVPDYTAGQDAALPLISPIFAETRAGWAGTSRAPRWSWCITAANCRSAHHSRARTQAGVAGTGPAGLPDLVRTGCSPGPPAGPGASAPSRAPPWCGYWTRAGRPRRSGREGRRSPPAPPRPAGPVAGR